jgi:hypothetical protein
MTDEVDRTGRSGTEEPDGTPAFAASLRLPGNSLTTARMAANELIRYLNHATLSWSAAAALPLPADTTRLIGALHQIARHMHEALGRAAERIAVIGQGSEESRLALMRLRSARETLQEVTGQLGQAHAAAAQVSC